jgi:hypothetical protein
MPKSIGLAIPVADRAGVSGVSLLVDSIPVTSVNTDDPGIDALLSIFSVAAMLFGIL